MRRANSMQGSRTDGETSQLRLVGLFDAGCGGPSSTLDVVDTLERKALI